jgi:hypothetical protein
MQPAYFFAVISLALASMWAPPAVEQDATATVAMQSGNAGDASATEQDALTGSIPAVLHRVTGEPLTCEQIRLIDEVELIADESYCG